MQKKAIQNVKTNHGPSIDWNIAESILSGVSIIDMKRLAIQNYTQASEYAHHYGLNLDDPHQKQIVQNIHIEAIQFIEDMFLDANQDTLIPPAVSAPKSPIDLLIYASGFEMGKNSDVQAWSCAVLKVMHCFFQLEHDPKLKNINTIRNQIFRDFKSLISVRDEAIFLENEQESFPLYFFKYKRNKSKNSIILKLLHKPHMVPADIYDHLGIRFVLNTKAECLLAFDFLWRHNLITEANVKPFRSRNTLIDMEHARRLFVKHKKRLESAVEYPGEIYKKIDKKLQPLKLEELDQANPFSATEYRSIQITVRKMIKLDEKPSSVYWFNEDHSEFNTFYFDYEIQLIDKATWLKTRRGPTSHAAYKRRQIEVAKTRVLGRTLLKQISESAFDKKADLP